MGTISKRISKIGYCVVDKSVISIPIEYISFLLEQGESRKSMTFIKNSNQCSYLSNGKCNLGRECAIYKEAEIEIKLDVSNLRF